MSPDTAGTTLPQRKDVPKELTWSLESIYPNNDAWEADFKRLQELYPSISEYKGKLGKGKRGKKLLAAIKLSEEIEQLQGRLHAYAHMRLDENTTNATHQAMDQRLKALGVQISAAVAFMTPEILAIKPKDLAKFLKKNPDLQQYEHMLDQIARERPHTFDVKTEEILTKAGELAQAPDDVYSMFNNADLKFATITGENDKPVTITHGNYLVLLRSANRSVRQAAFENVMGAYNNWRNTLSANYSAQVKSNLFSSRMRGHESARAAYLHTDNVPLSVYDNLIDTVTAGLPKLHRYLNLRKRTLGLDELHMWDLYVPMVAEVERKITYPEAKELVLKAVAPLGKDYCRVLKSGLNERRWVDVVETEGKRSGAYSSGTFGTDPFILMNWQEILDEVFTLAHEAGHSMQTYYSIQNQPFTYHDYTIFVAEVASTLNEGLLSHYMLQTNDDRKFRAYIVNKELEEIRLTLFRQTMFAEFEKEAHALAEAGEALTPDVLADLHTRLNKKYLGAECVIDEPIGMEWARIPHFYSSFYVYKYSTGISASKALLRRILKEGEPAVQRYLKFLGAGSSKYSIELLQDAGVDLTTPVPIEQTIAEFDEKVTELENLLK